MAYVKITNGTPEIYTIGQLRRDNPQTSFPRVIPDESLAAFNVFRTTVLPKPDVSDAQIAEQHPLPSQQDDGTWAFGWAVRSKTASELEADARQKKQDIKRRRDIAIKSGVTVNGMPVATDDLSQQRITSAALAATVDDTASFNWKLSNNEFVALSAAQIVEIAQVVRRHIQSCFDREAELLQSLQSGQPYDIDSGWPN